MPGDNNVIKVYVDTATWNELAQLVASYEIGNLTEEEYGEAFKATLNLPEEIRPGDEIRVALHDNRRVISIPTPTRLN